MNHSTSALEVSRLFSNRSEKLEFSGSFINSANIFNPQLHKNISNRWANLSTQDCKTFTDKKAKSQTVASNLSSNQLSQLSLKHPSNHSSMLSQHPILFRSNQANKPTQHKLNDGNNNPLTDSFSRQLTYLRLSITDFCNFRCGYCLPNGYQGKRPDNELTLAEIQTLVTAFSQVGTQKVRITGGEPSIRKDVTDIIECIHQTHGIKTVAMTSNGYKLHKHIKNWSDAGLNQINISVDSFDPATFHQMTGFDMLPQLIRDMDRLLETTDIKLKLNGILMANTAYDSLMGALDYIKTRPVTYRFIEFMQTSDNSDLFFAQHAQSKLIIEYLIKNGWVAHDRGLTDGPAIEYSHPDYVGRIGMIAPYAPQFCDNCNRLRVSSLGKVHLCLFDQGSYDVRDYLLHNDVAGLIKVLHSFMPIKPEHHHLAESNSGIMDNLSMIGG